MEFEEGTQISNYIMWVRLHWLTPCEKSFNCDQWWTFALSTVLLRIVIFLLEMPDLQQHACTSCANVCVCVCDNRFPTTRSVLLVSGGVNNGSHTWFEDTCCGSINIFVLYLSLSFSTLQGIPLPWCTGGSCFTSLPQLYTCSTPSLDWH